MDIRQINYVLEVAKLRSFSKAADNLYVSQPAISQQIKALEKELSVTLFKRDTHGVSLTADGEKFISYANDVLDASDRLFAAFNQSTTDNKENLTIGVFPFYKTSRFRKLINSYFANTSNVLGRIRVMDNYDAYMKVTSGDLDFAIIKSRPEDISDEVAFDVLESDRLTVLGSSELLENEGDTIPLISIGKYPLLTGENNSYFYKEMEKLYKNNDLEFNVSFLNTLETDLMMDMVEAGNGVLLMTENSAIQQLNEKLKAIPIEPEQWLNTILIYPKKRKLRGKAQIFRDYINDAFK